jgi:hypothetical protein
MQAGQEMTMEALRKLRRVLAPGRVGAALLSMQPVA